MLIQPAGIHKHSAGMSTISHHSAASPNKVRRSHRINLGLSSAIRAKTPSPRKRKNTAYLDVVEPDITSPTARRPRSRHSDGRDVIDKAGDSHYHASQRPSSSFRNGGDARMTDDVDDDVNEKLTKSSIKSPHRQPSRGSLTGNSSGLHQSFISGNTTAVDLTNVQDSKPSFEPDPEVIVDELLGLYADSIALINIVAPLSRPTEESLGHIRSFHDPHSQISHRLDRLASRVLDRAKSFTDELYMKPSLTVQSLFPTSLPPSYILPAMYRPDEFLMLANLAIYLIHIIRIDQRIALSHGNQDRSYIAYLLAPTDIHFPYQFATSNLDGTFPEQVGGTKLGELLFTHGLLIRTNLAIDHLRREDEAMIGPDRIISSLFYCSPNGLLPSGNDSVPDVPESQLTSLRAWHWDLTSPANADKTVRDSHESRTLDRIADIRQFCSTTEEDEDEDDDDDGDDDQVNIEGLDTSFPWVDFVADSVRFVRSRGDEIESTIRARGGAERIIAILRNRTQLPDEIARSDEPGSLFYQHPLTQPKIQQQQHSDHAKLLRAPQEISNFGLAMSSIFANGAQPDGMGGPFRPPASIPSLPPPPPTTIPAGDYPRDSAITTASDLLRFSQSNLYGPVDDSNPSHNRGARLPSSELLIQSTQALRRSVPPPPPPARGRFIDPQMGAERVPFSQPNSHNPGGEPLRYPSNGREMYSRLTPEEAAPIRDDNGGDYEMRDVGDEGVHINFEQLRTQRGDESSGSDDGFERQRQRLPAPPKSSHNQPHHNQSRSYSVSQGRDFHSVVMSPPFTQARHQTINPSTTTNPHGRSRVVALGRSNAPHRAVSHPATAPVPIIRRVSNAETPQTTTTPGGTSIPASIAALAAAATRPRRRWSVDEEQALIRYVSLFRASCWAEIKRADELEDRLLVTRTQVDLKDKARNLRLAMEKRGEVLPGFETVTLKATQVTMLEELRAATKRLVTTVSLSETPLVLRDSPEPMSDEDHVQDTILPQPTTASRKQSRQRHRVPTQAPIEEQEVESSERAGTITTTSSSTIAPVATSTVTVDVDHAVTTHIDTIPSSLPSIGSSPNPPIHSTTPGSRQTATNLVSVDAVASSAPAGNGNVTADEEQLASEGDARDGTIPTTTSITTLKSNETDHPDDQMDVGLEDVNGGSESENDASDGDDDDAAAPLSADRGRAKHQVGTLNDDDDGDEDVDVEEESASTSSPPRKVRR